MKQLVSCMTIVVVCLSSVWLLPTSAEPLLWQTYWQKAEVALKSKDYALACELLSAAVKELDVSGPPTDSIVMTVSALGYAQRQEKKYDEAKSNLNRAWDLAGQLHEEDRYAWVCRRPSCYLL